MKQRRIRCLILNAILLASALIAGCASPPRLTTSAHILAAGDSGHCAQFFLTLDRVAEQTNSLDAGDGRIEGYPYLRINRLLASFRKEVTEDERFNVWLKHLQELDIKARSYEIANLPKASLQHHFQGMHTQALINKVRTCGDLLKKIDFKHPQQRLQLQEQAQVISEYHPLPQVLGLYPLSRLIVAEAVNQWHAQARKEFSPRAPEYAQSQHYIYSGPRPTQAHLQEMLDNTSRDALGLPNYSAATLSALFTRYSPLWVVKQHSDDDRIGRPYWLSSDQPSVDAKFPVTYTHLSLTRFQGQVLTQLNYIIWFAARTPQHPFDLYAGVLDGVNLRITLNDKGQPMLYETIHNCGCYYKAYPTAQLTVKQPLKIPEPPLILPAPTLDHSTQILAVAMDKANHYVQHLYPAPPLNARGTMDYSLDDYHQLRSLEDQTDTRKSLFNSFGSVSNTDRLERFILWPTGIYSPGAMRQWGRQPIAFAGQRHFDDPHDMETMFTLTKP